MSTHIVYAVMIGPSGCVDTGIHSLHHSEPGATAEAERVNAETSRSMGFVSKWDIAHVERMEIRP